MIDPEDGSCGDAEGGHEGVGASVVSSVDAPPVLEPAEHILDLVALTVEGAVVRDQDLRLAFEGMLGTMPFAVKAPRNQSAS